MSNIEKIKAEIERRKNICEGIFEREFDTYYQGKAVAYGELLSYINSPQQEQHCDTCTNEKGCVTCKDGELWEGKPEVDLEKEIDKTVNECTDGYNFYWDRFARHFYEIGLNARKEESK